MSRSLCRKVLYAIGMLRQFKNCLAKSHSSIRQRIVKNCTIAQTATAAVDSYALYLTIFRFHLMMEITYQRKESVEIPERSLSHVRLLEL
jgi:hypothetical protein